MYDPKKDKTEKPDDDKKSSPQEDECGGNGELPDPESMSDNEANQDETYAADDDLREK
ncbi:hypothetical protein [Pinibacter aurantiacus]|uniref:Uncharacterized protein n=1 Tax=Pinibacter aurantiacus TaxID=2851599 RepID=A0A9E2W7R9_9BACT|nr:hypothetical protein [Pinibacter aurantiacus]MBV4357151.1 hypothetical protein [Pinibacter aurantiacus]